MEAWKGLQVSSALYANTAEKSDYMDKVCTMCDQKVHGKLLSFLHCLIDIAGITAHNTATHMQLIGYNMLDVSRLVASQLLAKQ